jgi:hypothetical protein
MYDANEVDNAIALLDPTVESINSQTNVLNGVDQSTWGGVYTNWQGVKNDWTFDKNGSLLPGPVYGSGIMARVQATQAQCNVYAAKIKAAGGQAPVVPADPTNNNPLPIPIPSTSWWPWVVGGVVVGAGLFMLDKYVDLETVLKGK